jgi:hypothetical protein
MSDQVRFWVRPIYHGDELLIEVLGDHRGDGFPSVVEVLREALQAVREAHPDNLDDPCIAMSQDRFFSYWAYPGGHYEIDDDTWGLFVSAKVGNRAVIADLERALLGSGRFVKEYVDFAQFK